MAPLFVSVQFAFLFIKEINIQTVTFFFKFDPLTSLKLSQDHILEQLCGCSTA